MRRRPTSSGPRGALIRAVALALLGLLGLANVAAAAGPPFNDRPADRHIIDDAKIFTNVPERGLEDALRGVYEDQGIDLVVLTQVKPSSRTSAEAQADAEALLAQWQVGGPDGDGAVMLWDLDRKLETAQVGIAVGAGLSQRVDAPSLVSAVDTAMASSLPSGDWLSALAQGVVALSVSVAGDQPPVATLPPEQPERTQRPRATAEPGSTRGPLPTLGPVPPAGPPYPEPIDGLRVYDYASVLRRETEERVAETIAAIEDRTGAQVAVYTQVKPESDSLAKAERDAAALMDQWGVGRRGFQDGLVILLDMTPDRCHGQVALLAGSGYEATFLTRQERQRIFDEEMMPALRECDIDEALLVAMAQIDEAATPEHAATLQLARQFDAATGLVAAPLVLVLIVGWAGWSWLRYGRDPEYLDDDSILMPAPPPDMTPAVASVVLDGRAGRHAIMTALVDLAARGEIAFRERSDGGRKVELTITVPDDNDPRQGRNRRAPLGEAEQQALRKLRGLAGSSRVLTEGDMTRFSSDSEVLTDRLDAVAAKRGWFREAPERSVERWSFRGGVILVLGAVGTIIGLALPSSGVLLLGVALLIASACVFVIARVMPQRTLEGARMYAQLAAYRRTLERTLARSRTMDQVVTSGVLPWVQTPDQAIVWSYALGLQEEAEEVLERSIEDVRAGTASPTRTYFPAWYVAGDGGRGGVATRGVAAGLFSAAGLPDFGHMSAALASIVTTPSSSGGSGGGSSGGFGGGSSSGGGAAGGGF